MLKFPARIMWLSLLVAPALADGQDVPRKDGLGDPLPPFAVARLGTQRLRHNYGAAAIAFSPDGATMATVARNFRGEDIRLWDVATGKQLRAIPIKHSIKSIDFAADGRTLIGAGVFTQAVYLFDVDTGALKQSIGKLPRGREKVDVDDTEEVRPLALSADGKAFVAPFTEERITPGEDGGIVSHTPQQWVKWFDASTGKQIRQMKLEVTRQRPQFFALSSDSKLFACVGDKQKILVYDRDRAEPLWRLEGHKEYALCGAFSADDATLATGGMDKRVRLWNLKTGKQQGELTRHNGSVLAVCFLPDRKTLASLSRDRICLWNGEDGKFLREFRVGGDRLIGMAVAARGDHLAGFCHDGTIIVWDLATGLALHAVAGHRANVNALAFSSNGKALVSGGDDDVLVWEISKLKLQHRLGTTAERLAFLPQPNQGPESFTRLVVGNTERPPELWDLLLRKRIRSLEGPKKSIHMRLSPAGKFLAALSWRRHDSAKELPVAYLWDVHKGDLRGKFGPTIVRDHSHHNCAIAYSPDGKLLATGGMNEPIRLFSAPDGKLVRTIDGSSDGLAFLPDGKLLASLDMGLTTFFDPETGEKRPTFGKIKGWGIGRGWPIVFSPDGRIMALAAEDGLIHLCEIATGWERACFKGHQGYVHALTFSPDGNRLVSAGEDTTILVWDLTGGKAAGVKAAWAALASDDGPTVRAGIGSLVATPKESLAYVKERLPPLRLARPDRVGKLLADLGDPKFSVREQATVELELLQELAVPALQAALDRKPEPEVSTRIEKLLKCVSKDRLEAGSERLRWLRALEVLERMRTPEARDIVRTLASGADEIRIGKEARTVLRRWPKQP